MLLEGHFGSDCRPGWRSEKYPSLLGYSAADFLSWNQGPFFSTELKVRRLPLFNFEAGFFSNFEDSIARNFQAVISIYSEKVKHERYRGIIFVYCERESQEALETMLGVKRRNCIEAQRFATEEAARPVQEVGGELHRNCWIYLAQSPVRLTKFG